MLKMNPDERFSIDDVDLKIKEINLKSTDILKGKRHFLKKFL